MREAGEYKIDGRGTKAQKDKKYNTPICHYPINLTILKGNYPFICGIFFYPFPFFFAKPTRY